MERTKITIEYPLATKSATIAWPLISEAVGLQKWMADYVDDGPDDTLVFKWGEAWTQQDVRESKLLRIVKNHYVRLRWLDDNEENEYWELRLEKSELTGDVTLVITDYADEDDVENICQVWDDCMERLHNASGL